RLEVGWYRFEAAQPVWLGWDSADRLALAEVSVQAPGQGWASLPRPDYAYEAGVDIGQVRLLGFEAPALDAPPGGTLSPALFWQSLETAPSPGLAVLQLVNGDGQVLAEQSAAPAGGLAPFTSLSQGQVVRDPWQLDLPAGLAPGVYDLQLGRRGAAGAWLPLRRGAFPLGETYPLATVRILGRQANMVAPQVEHPVDARFGQAMRLVGYDLVPPIVEAWAPGVEVELVVHWQALSAMRDRYKIFLHLVGSGGPADIRAQADVYPALPTTSWLPGEFRSDRVALELPASLPAGSYELLLGLYDETTGIRLPVTDAAGTAVGDALVLAELDLGP
ncbi:MAG: hypothetical protein ACK2U9_22730, partial [Anaerolineae bacterium]